MESSDILRFNMVNQENHDLVDIAKSCAFADVLAFAIHIHDMFYVSYLSIETIQ